MNINPNIVVRIPPSPTGPLHLGTVRTALYNYLYARQNGGVVMFRSEDTDSKRSSKEFEDEIINGLIDLGITWDNEIWRQSERTVRYKAELDRLLEEGKAYVSEEPSKSDPERIVSLIRLHNPNKTIIFNDLIRSQIKFDTTELGDFIIARAIDDPLYHFTVVVDDYDMGVTHIMRGEDHISNTPRQILIQEALGYVQPIYAHLPLILSVDKSKLSKRNGVVSIKKYGEMGILNESIINYIALLGWNPGGEKELFTIDELVKVFDVNKIQKGGAIFDMNKLKWINKHYLELLNENKKTTYIISTLQTELADVDNTILERFIKIQDNILERYHTKPDIINALKEGEWTYLIEEPEYDKMLLKWKNDLMPEDVLPRLQKLQVILENTTFKSVNEIKDSVFPYAEEIGRGEVLWPFRVALTGMQKSIDPFTVSYSLGKNTTLQRINKACDIIT